MANGDGPRRPAATQLKCAYMLLPMVPLPFDMPAVPLVVLCIVFLCVVIRFLGVVVFMLLDEDIEPPCMLLLFPPAICALALPAKASSTLR